MDLIDEGVFIIMALANSNISLDKIQKEILVQIESIKQGKLKQSELDKVKTNMRANFLYELESSSGVANLFGSYIARGDLQTLLDFEKNFEALKIQDIIEVANKYFNLNNATIATLQK